MVFRLKSYEEALDFLFARTTGATRLGLERTTLLLDALGNPHRKYCTLHVAGTNGKGSVVTMCEALLRAKGLRVGKYTSPHLIDFRERITVDGFPAEEAFVVEFVERWLPAIEAVGATFFEATTAMAFEAFAAAGVDAAVIETGLGGRLDSTNVLQPVAAAVTGIAIEHVDYLGDTREQIAYEKAGIFKRGVPAVIGEPDAHIRDLLARHAHDAGASNVAIVAELLHARDVNVGLDGTRCSFERAGAPLSLHIGAVGRHQVRNAATAITLMQCAPAEFRPDDDLVRATLRSVEVPGRCQVSGAFIFDVAHNPDGARALADTLVEVFPGGGLTAVVCVLEDKDWRSMLSELSRVVSHFVFTMAPSAPASRRWNLDTVRTAALERKLDFRIVPEFESALAAAGQSGTPALITGSFHTVGDAMARLQVSPFAG